MFSVQHECIPQAILSMDILCQAKSGMGKTAVFVLATLQQLEPVDGQVKYKLRFVVNFSGYRRLVCKLKNQLVLLKFWLGLALHQWLMFGVAVLF